MYYGQQQEQPKMNVKIYKGNNSISVATTDSDLLNSVQNTTKLDRMLAIANMKQFLSYHMIRIVSDSFNYLDTNIYNIINNYVNSLDIISFLEKEGGASALKFNVISEIYKLSQLLAYYQKPLLTDINEIREEIGALVDKLMKSN